MSSAVTLERYAEIRAEMEAGVLRDEALARAGMTTDQWTVAQLEWLEKMGTELDRGRFELSNRYSHAFLERQRALTSASASRVAEPASQEGSAVAAPQRPTAAALPSYLQTPVIQNAPQRGALPPVSRVPTKLSATGSFVAPLGPSLPFAKPPPGAPIALPPPTAGAIKPKPALGGTSFAIDNSAMRAALPFGGSGQTTPPDPPIAAPVTPVAAPPVTPPPTAKAKLVGTSFAIDNSAMRAALPFGGAPQTPATPQSPSTAPATPSPLAEGAPKPAPSAKPKLGSTSFAVDNSAMRAALPFAGAGLASKAAPSLTGFSAAAPPQSSTSTSLPGRAPPPLPAKAKAPPAGSETSMALDIPREALPFPSAPAGESPKPAAKVTLTLEQYASVCAEMAVAPGTEDAIRKKYGILDEGVWKALDNQWQAKFLFDPAARKKWLDLTEQYRRWLLAQAR